MDSRFRGNDKIESPVRIPNGAFFCALLDKTPLCGTL